MKHKYHHLGPQQKLKALRPRKVVTVFADFRVRPPRRSRNRTARPRNVN